MTRARYTADLVEHIPHDPHRSCPERTILLITDLNHRGALSVTDDIERVLSECARSFGARLPARVITRDRNGIWDAVRHTEGSFRGFVPLREPRLTLAIAKAFALEAYAERPMAAE